MNKYYAGIGSRQTPDKTLQFMTRFARAISSDGYILRSGGAEGADTAFANGAGEKEIFRPKDATPEAIELAMSIHPAPHRCNDYVKKLHGRNAQIILGRNLDSTVNFVVCWTKNGKAVGGTGLGINLARANDITVYNLFNVDDMVMLYDDLFHGRKNILDE